jgi:hypothetical protein
MCPLSYESRANEPAADVAQLAEQLICNQQVASSILAVSSVGRRGSVGELGVLRVSGGVPKWLNGADCKSAGYGLRRFESYPHHSVAPVVGGR